MQFYFSTLNYDEFASKAKGLFLDTANVPEGLTLTVQLCLGNDDKLLIQKEANQATTIIGTGTFIQVTRTVIRLACKKNKEYFQISLLDSNDHTIFPHNVQGLEYFTNMPTDQNYTGGGRLILKSETGAFVWFQFVSKKNEYTKGIHICPHDETAFNALVNLVRLETLSRDLKALPFKSKEELRSFTKIIEGTEDSNAE